MILCKHAIAIRHRFVRIKTFESACSAMIVLRRSVEGIASRIIQSTSTASMRELADSEEDAEVAGGVVFGMSRRAVAANTCNFQGIHDGDGSIGFELDDCLLARLWNKNSH